MKDGIEFHFEDDTILSAKFDKGKTDNPVSKTNDTMINYALIERASTTPLRFVRLLAHKTGYFLDCFFSSPKSDYQYGDEYQGQILFRKMARLIIANSTLVNDRFSSLLDASISID